MKKISFQFLDRNLIILIFSTNIDTFWLNFSYLIYPDSLYFVPKKIPFIKKNILK